MPVSNYSLDVFDYLADMPGLPSRADRDALVRRAQDNPEEEKRVHIWDFFFSLRPQDVGKPQLKEIERIEQERNADLRQTRTKFMNLFRLLVAMAVFGIILGIQPFLSNSLILGIAIFLLASLGTIGAILWYLGRQSQINTKTDEEIRKLSDMVLYLRLKVPRPPSDAQIDEWFREDLYRLGQLAIERTTSESKYILIEGVKKPLCILGPAKLQNAESIKKRLPNLQIYPDLQKHLDVFQYGLLPEERFDIFYGIYYIEFLVVGKDMLANYGCFFDFITNQIYGEHSKEMYYDDVVSIGTRYEYQYRNPWVQGPNISLPTFSLSLKSGEKIEVTFANEQYLQAFAQQSPNRSWRTDTWERNPEQIARQVIDALRGQLHRHKAV